MPSPGILWFCLGPLGCRPSERARKSSKSRARFVTGNYKFKIGSMTGILEHLGRRDSRPILLYKGLKGKASIPTDDLIPLVRLCRNDHSMAYIRFPLLTLIFISVSFSPRPLGIGITSKLSYLLC